MIPHRDSSFKRTDYRPDIDGLRAVAVLAVIAFHANAAWLPGGFVGVDVFFVISGFVITRSLFGYSGSLGSMLQEFYGRRIRRLLPAAALVVAYTSVMAWHLLPPEALAEYTRSLVAFLSLWSNWFFLSIAGYFDGPSELKPLLHTWSLSIEEQFYLLFPIPILLLRKSRRALAGFFAAVVALSLGYSMWLVQTGGAEAAFFNSFGRFWEIALGGLVACASLRLHPVASLAGVGAIFVSFWFLDAETPFPGLAALLPTLGTAAIIASTGNRVLASRPMTWIGEISYGLYLWHWPIFVTIAYGILNPQPVHYLVGIAATFLAAALSYYLVEEPIRHRKSLPLPRFAYMLLAGALPFAVAAAGAVTGEAKSTVAQEYASAIKVLRSKQQKAAMIQRCWMPRNTDMAPVFKRCATPKPDGSSILLIGDSHAAQYIAAIRAAYPGRDIDLLAVNSCWLEINPNLDAACNELIEWVNTDLASAGYQRAILGIRADGLSMAKEAAAAARLLSKILPVTVIGPVPHYNPDVATLFNSVAGAPQRIKAAHFAKALNPEIFRAERVLADDMAKAGITYVSMIDALCPRGPKSCRHFTPDGWPILVDYTHLSVWAARLAVAKVADQIVR